MKTHKLPTKKTLWLILLTILTISATVILLKNAGTYLIRTDTPSKPTPTIILMGSIADRVLETNDRYKAGLTDTIIIANSNQSGGEALLQYGITIPNNTALSAQTLTQLGIPDSSIFILPGKTKSTRDEADTLIRRGGSKPTKSTCKPSPSSPPQPTCAAPTTLSAAADDLQRRLQRQQPQHQNQHHPQQIQRLQSTTLVHPPRKRQAGFYGICEDFFFFICRTMEVET
jgi:hypothetical protein